MNRQLKRKVEKHKKIFRSLERFISGRMKSLNGRSINVACLIKNAILSSPKDRLIDRWIDR